MNEKALLDPEFIRSLPDGYETNPHHRIVANALTKNEVNKVAYSFPALTQNPFKFSKVIDTGAVTAQKQSGRCWMFAVLNLLRYNFAKSINVGSFEFSENYLAFWDKFEKYNKFYENIIETADLPFRDRAIHHLFSHCVGDGGTWDMCASLCQKYGLVPKDAMPETCQSSATGNMNGVMSAQLRKNALALRKMRAGGAGAEEMRACKKQYLQDAYAILCMCFGTPPQTFRFEYYDKDEAFHDEGEFTPQDFYSKYIHFPFEDYIPIVNVPVEDRPFNQTYSLRFRTHGIDGKPVILLNAEIDALRNAVICGLEAGEPMVFSADVAHYMDRDAGQFIYNMFDYNTLFGMDFSMPKPDQMMSRNSSPNHMMLFTGINYAGDGSPNRYKVQNSWGDEKAEKGYFVMDAKWFDMLVYGVFANKKYLPEALVEAYKKEPVIVDPWDFLH